MPESRPQNLDEFRIKASILLKQLRREDSDKALSAALRFQRLSHLAELSIQEIVRQKDRIKLKHALTVIALENNCASWVELKERLERLEKSKTIRNNSKYTPLYPKRCAGFINAWYRSHEDALGHLAVGGGYLLPYREHFFVCQRNYIETLGLDPDHPDWARIGWDWVNPGDQDARQRLEARLLDLVKQAEAVPR